MLTLRRFRALAAAYGADPARWPAAVREAATALTAASPEARAMLERERRLDATLAADAAQDGPPAGSTREQAALARLRTGVAARLVQRAPSGDRTRAITDPAPWRTGLRPIAFMGAAGLAIAAGITLGALYTPDPPQDTVLALLQTTPFPASD